MPSLSENTTPAHQSTVQRLLTNQILWMLFLRVVLYTLILGVSTYLQSGKFNVVILPLNLLFIFILLIYITSISSSLILLRRKPDPRRFGFKQILLDTFFVSILLYYTGGSESIFSPLYFFPIIAGGLILPRLGGLIAAGAASLQYALVLILGYYRIFPAFLGIPFYDSGQDLLSSLNLFAVYGLIFFLTATLSSLFAGRLRSTEDALSDSVRDFDRLSLLYKQIFDDISTGIITTDEQNRITSANTATSQITGYSLPDLLDKEFHEIFPNVSFSNKGSRHSAAIQRKDGEQTRIGYSYAQLQYLQFRESEEEGGEDNDIYENCKVITIQDISEVERLEQQMQQAEKLAAIGRMSAGIAHDFRNPLTAISGSAQVLANELELIPGPHRETNAELINIIQREAGRLSNTVSDFLKFARPEHAEHDWFSLQRSLNEVLQVAKAAPSWPATITLDIQIDDVVDIWADHYQLFTILNHLIQNALSFALVGKELIRIQAIEVAGNDEDTDQVIITVEDNGPGIPPGNEEAIFEPFYTNRVDGTGLGLAIVKQMIEGHKGSIEVERSSIGGAKFTVSFPLPNG